MDRWRTFASEFLGMQLVDVDGGRLALRMDERSQRFIVRPGIKDSLCWIGLELADASAFARTVRALSDARFSLTQGDASERNVRDVAEMVWFEDPDGNRIELYHGPGTARLDFAPSRPIGGFRTDNLGLGHVVLQTANYSRMRHFYMNVLGFRLSDYMDSPIDVCFLHTNPRHHSLALLQASETKPHHVMIEYNYLDDVGRLYDTALAEPDGIITTLGRHSNDHVLSFYHKSPSDFLIEIGWAGRLIDDDTWKAEKIPTPSIWGHDRSWLPAGARAEIRKEMDKLAAAGVFAPTEVVDSKAFNLTRIGRLKSET